MEMLALNVFGAAYRGCRAAYSTDAVDSDLGWTTA